MATDLYQIYLTVVLVALLLPIVASADVWMQTGQFATPAASSTTTITMDGDNTGPVCIHMWSSDTTVDDTNSTDTYMMHGFDDGTTNRMVGMWAEQGTDNTRRYGSNGNSLQLENTTTDADLVVAAVSSMNSTSVVLTYTTWESGNFVNYVIFGGSDTSCVIGEGTSNDSGSPITGVGFTSDLILFATHGAAAGDQAQYSYLSFGAAANGTDEWAVMSFCDDNASATRGSVLTVGEVAGQHDLGFADWGMQVLAIDSDGFTYENVPTADTGGSDVFTYMALNFNGIASAAVGTFTKTISAGPVDQDLPDLGFTAQGFFLGSAAEAGTDQTNQNNCRVAFGAYDGTNQVSAIATGQDGDNTDSHSRSNASEVLQLAQDLDTNGVQSEATAAAITDATPTINWNPNDTANAAIIGYYAIEAEAEAVSRSRILTVALAD